MFGRMLFIGLSTNDRNIIKRLIKECHVGGFILYSKNYRNYEEMIELIHYIKHLATLENYTILIGIDQEGYRVNRLPKDFINLRSPYSLHNDLNSLKVHAQIIANILSSSGIQVNFAPVLDIKRFSDQHAIGDRALGSDLKTVIQNGIPYFKEFKKKNVLAVVKHFPGHGATSINSHYFFPIIWKKKQLLQEDVLPFREAIYNDVDAIMVGHFTIPNFSGWIPSTLSKKTVQYLRNDLHFKKLIVTDDFYMGLFRLFNKTKLIKKSINSGFNLILIKYYDRFFLDYNKLLNQQKRGKLNNDFVQYSIKLIQSTINDYHITNELYSPTLDISKINKQIIQLNNKNMGTK